MRLEPLQLIPFFMLTTLPRGQAEELLARKRAQLEEASRLRVAAQQHQAESAAAHHAAEAGPEPAAAGADSADQDRLKRAEIFRQVRIHKRCFVALRRVLMIGVGQQKKMAELASRRGTDVDGAAAAKKAAFLKEAEEAVRRATLQVRGGDAWTRHGRPRLMLTCPAHGFLRLMMGAGHRKLPGGVQPQTARRSLDLDWRVEMDAGAGVEAVLG